MVDVVSGVVKAALGHWLEDLILLHTVQDPVAHIGVLTLYGVNAALGKVKCHRPVIGDGIHNILHARMYCSLCGPNVGPDNRDILRNVAVNRSHKLGVLLVGGIVGKRAEAFIVQRFPHELVEQLVFRKSRAHRI